jgi:hypothetical protein
MSATPASTITGTTVPTATAQATTATAPIAPTNPTVPPAPTPAPLVEYKPRRTLCCTLYKDRSNFQNVLQSLELTNVQKEILKIRYLAILENFKRRSRNYSAFFFLGHTIITVGSLFVPALLSIQNSDKSILLSGENFNVHVYWTTFVISLLVTIFNGLLTLFKVDKKYYFLNTTLERLRSEGWQYFSLTGRYSGHLINHQMPTHSNQFVYFTHYIEKIKMKQVEEEYFKADEKSPHVPTLTGNSTATGRTQTTVTSELYPLSPDQSIESMMRSNNIPDPVKHAMNSLVKSQRTVDNTKKEENEVINPTTTAAATTVPAKVSPLQSPSLQTRPTLRRTSIVGLGDASDIV